MKTSGWLLLIFLIACAPAAQQPIKIGAVAALSGNLAGIAADEKIGLDIAVDEINAAGGIKGKPVKIIWEDGKCDPKEATTAATKLVEVDGVKIILGGTCTGESMAISKIADTNKIIQMSALTSGSVYSNTGPWTFRTNPVDNAKDLVQHLLSKGYKRLALISEQTDFSQSIRKDFKNWVQEGGGEITADENFDSKETDFRTVLGRMKESKADAYFLNTNSAAVGIALSKQAKELSMSPLYGSRGFETAKPGEAVNELEGIIFYGTSNVVNLDTSQAKKVFDEYEKRIGNRNFKAFAVSSRYDGFMIIAKALETCGEDNECIRNWLNNMPPYEGISGTFKFDENGDPVGIKYAFAVFHNGKIEPLKE